MSGGFIPTSTPALPTDALAATSISDPKLLLSLTSRQENRLRVHIDDRLLSLERDERKHAFGSLQDLLARLLPLLHLILQIPPLDPWSSLRISYLLTFTGSVPTYITSLPLLTIPSHTTSTGDPDLHDVKSFDVEQQTARTMRALLDFPNLVDKGWQAVLRGDGWLPPSKPGGRGKAVRVDYSGSVGVTERIRIRSIIIAGREKVLAWARTYGNFRGSSFPDGEDPDAEVDQEDDERGAGWEWEAEIMGMWKGTLEMVADHDFRGDDAYA